MIITLSAGMQRKKMNFLKKNVDMSVFGTGEYGKPKLTGVLAGLPAPGCGENVRNQVFELSIFGCMLRSQHNG